MKKTRLASLLALLLVCAMIFGACAQRPKNTAPEVGPTATEVPQTAAPADSAESAAEATPEPAKETATPEPTAAPTEEPTPVPSYTNPLTGETASKDYSKTRPVAVMVENNHNNGMINQAGISKAAILVEFQVEKITRNMAIFMDLEDVPAIYPVRSARSYFVSTAMAFDAIYVHRGQSADGVEFAQNVLVNFVDHDDIDLGDTNSYRMETWPHIGEHGMGTSGELLLRSFEAFGTRTEHKTDSFDYGLHFTENAAPTGGEVANTIRVVYPENKIMNFTYDASKNGYTGYQWDTLYVDDTTGQEVVFQNVLILATPVKIGADDHWHSVITTTDYEGTGLFFNGGYVEAIKWSRGGLDTPFRFYDQNGNDLELGIGHTYMGFVSSTYGGATYS
ncbi:MAG: DUF3048 domain-containing protein [Oscillospiraceae bacterium]|nr:DUF3048 domain-containing protein [Oscillospiraceae bacterium]